MRGGEPQERQERWCLVPECQERPFERELELRLRELLLGKTIYLASVFRGST